MAGIAHLARRVSDNVHRELEGVRDLARRGRLAEAERRLITLMADRLLQPVLEPAVRALALRLKTGLALGRGDPSAARMALQELDALEAPDGLGILRTAIVHQEEGPEKALEVLAKQTDPDSWRFKAALLLEKGEFARVIETLDTSDDGKDAETLCLRAWACLCLGAEEEAFSAAQAALDLQPEWLSARIAFASVGYFTSLSHAALPYHALSWPQPVSWTLVRRDDESAERRRRAAEEALRGLHQAELDRGPRRVLETLHLACLACDPRRREESETFCQELVRRDRLHVPAIAWALGRGFQLDLSKCREALQQRLNSGLASSNEAIALVACHLRDGRRQQAAKILERSRPIFEQEGHLDLWLAQETQILRIDSGQRLEDEESNNPEITAAGAKHDAEELGLLANRALEEKQGAAFVEACEALARHGEWPVLSRLATELIEVIGTADAARMAAVATFKQARYQECIEILGNAEPLFPGRRLSADLLRLRVQTLTRLGRSPEAIELAERVAQEEPALEHQLDLVSL
jgi:tetratricopeptide (TPR) repeat protein